MIGRLLAAVAVLLPSACVASVGPSCFGNETCSAFPASSMLQSHTGETRVALVSEARQAWLRGKDAYFARYALVKNRIDDNKAKVSRILTQISSDLVAIAPKLLAAGATGGGAAMTWVVLTAVSKDIFKGTNSTSSQALALIIDGLTEITEAIKSSDLMEKLFALDSRQSAADKLQAAYDVVKEIWETLRNDDWDQFFRHFYGFVEMLGDVANMFLECTDVMGIASNATQTFEETIEKLLKLTEFGDFFEKFNPDIKEASSRIATLVGNLKNLAPSLIHNKNILIPIMQDLGQGNGFQAVWKLLNNGGAIAQSLRDIAKLGRTDLENVKKLTNQTSHDMLDTAKNVVNWSEETCQKTEEDPSTTCGIEEDSSSSGFR